MTAHESKVLEALTDSVNALKTRVEVHIAKTDQMFTTLKALCDERHGFHPGRFEHLEEGQRQARSFQDKLKGMGIPIAICIAVISIILNLFT